MNILIYVFIINRAIALKQSLDMQPEFTANSSMKWTPSGNETVTPLEATVTTYTDEQSSRLPLFNAVHLSGAIACGLSLIASVVTIAVFFTNTEKNIYKRKVNQ